jgi:hypothetical protein
MRGRMAPMDQKYVKIVAIGLLVIAALWALSWVIF